MGEHRLVPLHLTFDGACVGIEQQLGGITAMSFLRLPRTVHAEAVALAGSKIGQIAVPAKAGYLRKVEPGLLPVFVEQASSTRSAISEKIEKLVPAPS